MKEITVSITEVITTQEVEIKKAPKTKMSSIKTEAAPEPESFAAESVKINSSKNPKESASTKRVAEPTVDESPKRSKVSKVHSKPKSKDASKASKRSKK